MSLGFGLLAALLVIAATAHDRAERAFRRSIEERTRRLREGTPRERIDPASPVAPIVAAFAERSVPGGPVPRAVELDQRAEMRMKPGGPWIPIRATQTIAIREPGFVWVAEGRMGPRPVTVVDAYVGGEGLLEARLLGSIRVARSRSRPRAPVVPAAVRLRFDEAGDLRAIEADERGRMEGGRPVPRPWRGSFDDDGSIGGYRIPTRGEVSWALDDGLFPYWRGTVVGLRTIT